MKISRNDTLRFVFLFLTIIIISPFTTIIAKEIELDDPSIVFADAKLKIHPKIKSKNNCIDPKEIIFLLEVKLKATKYSISKVNGKLFFSNDSTYFYEYPKKPFFNHQPIIIKDIARWNTLKRGIAKKSEKAFKIQGLNTRTDKISFRLEIEYQNSFSQSNYSKTINFTLFIPQTQISITNVSYSNSIPKGKIIPVDITVYNHGPYEANMIALGANILSKKAKGSSLPYRNANGAVNFVEAELYLENIPVGQSKTFTLSINFKHTICALNVGDWEMNVAAQAGNSELYEVPIDYDFQVIPRTSGRPAVFIYYLWNNELPYPWPENPKKYIINDINFGKVHAGLHQFRNYNFFDLIFCRDDDSWEIPFGAQNYLPTSELVDRGEEWVGQTLNILGGKWIRENRGINVNNCGYDILLLAAARNSDHMGVAISNVAFLCKSGKSTIPAQWKNNIDGVAQHEISHIFGCHDAPPHSLDVCIMVYSKSDITKDHLFEYHFCFFNKHATNIWCKNCKTILSNAHDHFIYAYV
jgi:hypothetical protein